MKGSIVAPVTTAETPPTIGSAFIARGALVGKIMSAPSTSKNPVTDCIGIYFAAFPIKPKSRIVAAIAIMIAADTTGFGAAAVPVMIGSIGEPPRNALPKPPRPAIMFVASNMLVPDPVTA